MAHIFRRNLCDLQAAQPCDATRRGTVVMEEIPPPAILANAVMGGPPHDGLKQYASEGERSVGVVAYSIAQQMGVTRGIAEIVFPIVFVHP